MHAAGMLQACCRAIHTLCEWILNMAIWRSILNFLISQTQWYVLEVFKHPVHSAGMLQEHCRHAAVWVCALCICVISMSIWMSILPFLSSQTQWYVLEVFKHPVHSAGMLQEHCRHAAVWVCALCICVISMSIWMSILPFLSSQTQWHVLKSY